MTSASQTHIGYVRDENQDRVGIRQYGENLLLIVCDGMGGERSGSKASSMATDVFFEHFEESYTEDMDAYSIRSLLLSSVSAANSVVYTTARMDYQNFGMGTTCVAAFVAPEYGGSGKCGRQPGVFSHRRQDGTGDDGSHGRAYAHGKGRDHRRRDGDPSSATYADEGGGRRTDGLPDFFRIDLEKDQAFRLLLCSDGLSGFCSDAEIETILKEDLSDEETAQKLIDAALEKGGRDNISVALATVSHNTEE